MRDLMIAAHGPVRLDTRCLTCSRGETLRKGAQRPRSRRNQRRWFAVVETFVQSTGDVVEFLQGQHNQIKDMFDDVVHASGSKAREKAFVDLRHLLAVHETAEEMVVHPRARRELDGGDIDRRRPAAGRARGQGAAVRHSKAWTSTRRSSSMP